MVVVLVRFRQESRDGGKEKNLIKGLGSRMSECLRW